MTLIEQDVSADAIPRLRQAVASAVNTRLPGIASRIADGDKLEEDELSSLASLVGELAGGQGRENHDG